MQQTIWWRLLREMARLEIQEFSEFFRENTRLAEY